MFALARITLCILVLHGLVGLLCFLSARSLAILTDVIWSCNGTAVPWVEIFTLSFTVLAVAGIASPTDVLYAGP